MASNAQESMAQSAPLPQIDAKQVAALTNPIVDQPNLAITQIYRRLQEQCRTILESSVSPELCQALAESHLFLHELDHWSAVIKPGREEFLIANAGREYQHALLAALQGQYRHGFKGLRLVLELCLQTCHLSCHRIELQEWLNSTKDTTWDALIDKDNGVLSPRFASAFFPDMGDHIRHFQTMSAKLYRECSECVHGNRRKFIQFPESLEFSVDALRLWHEKAKLISLASNFALALRYLKDMPQAHAQLLEQHLLDRLGHIEPIRRHFGGPGGG